MRHIQWRAEHFSTYKISVLSVLSVPLRSGACRFLAQNKRGLADTRANYRWLPVQSLPPLLQTAKETKTLITIDGYTPHTLICGTPISIGGYTPHTQHANFHRRMHCETRSRFAASTRGSALLCTTEETEPARREIDRNAPPPFIFLLYVYGK